MRDKCFLLMVFFNLLLAFVSIAEPANDEIKKMNELAENGKLNEAKRIYLKWIRSGYESKLLYYNVGLIYEKNGDAGNAMFFLKKAQKLAPNDDLIENRLLSLQEKIKDRFMIPIENRRKSDIIIKPWKYFTSQNWAIFLLAGVWIYVIHYLYYRLFSVSFSLYFYKPLQKIQIFMLLFLLIQFIRIINYWTIEEAIILPEEVKVFQGADTLSPIIQTVHAGLPVLFEDKIGEWVKITLKNGRTGWVKKSHLSAKI